MKPILFNTEMVRAILEGRKTVTRRVVKPQPIPESEAEAGDVIMFFGELCKLRIPKNNRRYAGELDAIPIQPCCPGDILYVRETWNYGYFESSDAYGDTSQWFEELSPKGKKPDSFLYAVSGYIYKADFDDWELINYGIEHDNGKIHMDWHPSIHMPKEAARIFLRVTDVRVERLNEIDELGALDEGAFQFFTDYGLRTAREDFAILWDETIKPSDLDHYGWTANPWVWVIEFEKISKQEAAGT